MPFFSVFKEEIGNAKYFRLQESNREPPTCKTDILPTELKYAHTTINATTHTPKTEFLRLFPSLSQDVGPEIPDLEGFHRFQDCFPLEERNTLLEARLLERISLEGAAP